METDRSVKAMAEAHSITRFPLGRFSPGAGLLRYAFCSLVAAKTFQGLGPKRRESSNGDWVYVYIYIYIERERENSNK